MAIELNTPRHEWYMRVNHYHDPRIAVSRTYIDPDLIPGFDTTGPTRDTNPFSTPNVSKIGTQEVVTQGTYSATGGGSVNVVTIYRVGGVDQASPYTPQAFDDVTSMVIYEEATESGGTNDGVKTTTVNMPNISNVAPVAGALLLDQNVTLGTGIQNYDTSFDFTGEALVYSLDTVITGVLIAPNTGIISFNTAIMDVQAGTNITVRATNSGGFALSSFDLAAAAAVANAFIISEWTAVDDITDDTTLNVTIIQLPNSNGSAITDVEYQLDTGSWVSSGGIGNFDITGLTTDQNYDVNIRSINSVGPSLTSDTKNVTVRAAVTAPDAFTVTQWN